MKYSFIFYFLLITAFTTGCQEVPIYNVDENLTFLDPDLPDRIPKIFAVGKVSTPFVDWGISITEDCQEIFYTINSENLSSLVTINFIDGKWSEPKILPFSGKYKDFCPNISPDGKRMVFGSRRPTNPADTLNDGNYWCVERKNGDWSNPYLIEEVSSDKNESFLFMHGSGDLYFNIYDRPNKKMCLYYSRYSNGKYSKPEKLKGKINTEFGEYCPYVSPDEDYMIVEIIDSTRGLGGGDMYLSLKQEDGTWGSPLHMGEAFNSEAHDCFPILTPGGKFIIFMSCRIPSFQKEDGVVTYNELLFNSINQSKDDFDFYWVRSNLIADIIDGRTK